MTPAARPDAIALSLGGRCPRCGQGRLFKGVAALAPQCASCGLDFAALNVGDGPAAFLTLILGFVIVGGALWLEFAVSPPFWVHLVLWTPLLIGAVLISLRGAKAVLVAQEVRHQAHEGRLTDDA